MPDAANDARLKTTLSADDPHGIPCNRLGGPNLKALSFERINACHGPTEALVVNMGSRKLFEKQ